MSRSSVDPPGVLGFNDLQAVELNACTSYKNAVIPVVQNGRDVVSCKSKLRIYAELHDAKLLLERNHHIYGSNTQNLKKSKIKWTNL